MSRAFVKESDGPDVATRLAPELPPGTPNHVTPWGAAALRRELERLREEARSLSRATDGLSVARLAQVRADVRYLEGRIATFVETPPPDAPERVGFGTRVRLEGDQGERVVEIVGVDEVDPASGRISWLSPLARALIGASVDDEVELRTPSGEQRFVILAVERGG